MNKKLFLFYLIGSLSIFLSCDKDKFLNEKPRKDIVVPSTIEDFQALLDDDVTMNGAAAQGLTPQLGESASDNIYLLQNDYNNILRPQMQNYYVWAKSPYAGLNVTDWEYPYKAILYANTVLDGIKRLQTSDSRVNELMGQALFHRAYMYFSLAQIFAPPYTHQGSNLASGLLQRLSSDISEPLKRMNVEETYSLMIKDAHKASVLLKTPPLHGGRASKQAAFGLLARIYLSMQDYDMAGRYADSCLAIQSKILNYNSLNLTTSEPFVGINHPIYQEVIFYSAMQCSLSQNFPTSFNFVNIDSLLYDSYHSDDLRKKIFFEKRGNGSVRFKGSYSYRGAPHYFSGLATDEILLIRAECYARQNKLELALADINRLLYNRFKEGTFVPFETSNKNELINYILDERRKELLMRGLRWTDLRRLNEEGRNITLKRYLNGESYILSPDDHGWTWPFPVEVKQ